MNLDDELRRLFEDERLELRAPPNAVESVLSGARRRRRQRHTVLMATSTLGVVVVFAAGLALAGVGWPTSLPPAASLSVSASPSASPVTTEPEQPPDASQAPAVPTNGHGPTNREHSDVQTSTRAAAPRPTVPFGPFGYNSLRLGMTEAEALATGKLTANSKPESDAGCRGFDWTGTPNRAGYYAVVISKQYGVVRFGARDDSAATPEGIRIGSSSTALDAAYPNYTSSHGAVNERVVSVVGNDTANYWIIVRDQGVTALRLELKTQDCYE